MNESEMTVEQISKKRANNKKWMNEDRAKNPDKYRERGRRFYSLNPQKVKGWREKWQSVPENAEQKRQYNNKRYRSKKELLLAQCAASHKRRLASDPLYRACCSLRLRTKLYLKKNGLKKRGRIMTIVGCSPQELKIHLESKFQHGMSWQNFGRNGWHIDHNVPLSSAKTQEGVEVLCHYSNLQPLWAWDNLSKGSKL